MTPPIFAPTFFGFADLGADLGLTIKAQEAGRIQLDECHVDSPITTKANLNLNRLARRRGTDKKAGANLLCTRHVGDMRRGSQTSQQLGLARP